MLIYGIATILTAIFFIFAEIFYKRYLLKTSIGEETSPNKKSSNYVLFLLFMVLAFLPYALVSGFRYGVGTDYFYMYYPGFYRTMNSIQVYKEPLFQWFNVLLGWITDDATWLFIITAALFNLFLVLSIKKMTSNWWMAGIMVVASNVFFISMNNVRQFLALSIAIYAFTFAADKKYVRCAIFGLIAIGIHFSAAVLIPIYILCGIKKIRKVGIWVLLGLILLSPAYIPLAKFILQNTKYADYFNGSNPNDLPLIHYLIPQAMIFILSLITYKDLIKKNNYAFGLLIVNTIALIISILSFFYVVNETMSRACNWFSWSIIFLVPMITYDKQHKPINYIIMTLVACVCACCTYYLIGMLGHHEVLPYRSIFSK